MTRLPHALLAVLMAAVPAQAEGPHVSGPPATAFDWSADRCATWDIPDAPARAWRDGDGTVHLLSGSERSRVASGPGLDQVERSCDVAHSGAERGEAALYDDRTWIASTWIGPDGVVTALGHVEHHRHRRAGDCRAGTYMRCWRNAIVELSSTDGGRAFGRHGDARDLVAALPYRADPAQRSREGYFNPSNILERDGHLHAFVFAEATGAQRRGPCLLRRPLAGGPGDWRAWDGAAFAARFADPYAESPADPSRHVCAPVADWGSTMSSVVLHPGRGAYLAVTPATRRDGEGRLRSGIWWATSTDLLTWTTPELLLDVPLLWRRDCAAEAAYAYPSLLDPDSASPNFETVDDGFRLYLVRLRLREDCSVGPDRDLVRWEVAWPAE